MSTESRERDGVLDGIRVDVVRLHETWMELVFPRQRGKQHSVLGKWKPRTSADKVKYRVWGALGALVVALLYPLLLVGLAARFYARRFDSAATRLGLVGVVLGLVVLWGALTALARVQLDPRGFYAVAGASVVAVLASVVAVTAATRGGRLSTVLIAYPAGMTALFLPPVVAAFFSETLGSLIFPRSVTIAEVLLNTVASRLGVEQFFRQSFELEGLGYVLLWFGIAVPLGWLFGILVSLADLARPKHEEGEPDDAGGSGGSSEA
jgi:Ca2+/H+ antiporter